MNRKGKKAKIPEFYDSTKYKALTRVIQVSGDIDFVETLATTIPKSPESKPKAKRGPPKKPLKDLKKSQLFTRSKSIKQQVQQFSKEENIPASEVLGLIGQKIYLTEGQDRNQSKGRMFKNIADGKDPFEKKELNPDQGIFLQESLAVGRTKYEQHDKFMKVFDINMPSSAAIRKRKLEKSPPIHLKESFRL